MGEFIKDNKVIDDVPDDELFCDVCGMTYKEFIETGVFGCENCYKVFKSRTIKLIKKKLEEEMPQKQVVVETVSQVVEKPKSIKREIEKLKELLKLCKKLDEKEKAEKIEARIKELEEIEK
jgi:protein arginine kinase activator